SLLQKKGFDEMENASEYYRQAKGTFDKCQHELDDAEEVHALIIKAYDLLLLAETSCNYYWGSKWVHKSFDALEQVYYNIDVAMQKMEIIAKDLESSSQVSPNKLD
ncbi:MAG: hypothetical protein HQL32_15265, partial [Planctomycetes bacterium]|nr:hypothetical protein [Planctomycetota bacterium]